MKYYLAIVLLLAAPIAVLASDNVSQIGVPLVYIYDDLDGPDEISLSSGDLIKLCIHEPHTFFLINRSSFFIGFTGSRIIPEAGEFSPSHGNDAENVFIETSIPALIRVFWDRRRPVYLRIDGRNDC